MLKHIEVTAKTEDEAIAKGLAQLGMDRDDVSVEILERGKTGFLGIGSVPAKVKLTYEVPDELDPAPVPAPPAAEERPAPGYARPEPHAQRPAPKAQTRPQPQPVPKAAPVQPVPAPKGEPVDDDVAAAIVEFQTGLFRHMGVEAVPVVRREGDTYQVVLEGEEMGALIGHRGETLDAIQQLTSYCVNRSGEKRVRIHVDAENYRAKREQSLQSLARKVAAKVVRNRRNVTLEPMNAYERHVIHTALQDVEGVSTYSMGTEPNRRVIVAYDRSSKEQRR